ncbi:probable methyltransferase PMT25 [Prosopis cineraria]|uniref:probable methyltransferase PMT25 n=1 Tax=Prosopis cineraria TaxID=364024 RepID=UPI00240EE297|nr:probable methyltransferase PMT25 [Prosopis cineraria]XP_054788653.1 probable methyltransferase PMT25 [Prosopis cineraria]
MAIVKNSRVEERKKLNYYSTVSVAVFVAFCLLGVWIVMSFIAPLQNSELLVSETINEVKNIVGEDASTQFENSSADIVDESTKADLQANKSESENHLKDQEEQKATGELYGNTAVANRLEDTTRESSDEKNDSDKGSSTKEKDFNRNLNSESVETETLGVQTIDEKDSDKNVGDNKIGTDKSTDNIRHQAERAGETVEEMIKKNMLSKTEQSTRESIMESHESSQTSEDAFNADTGSGILNGGSATAENGTWSTQAVESQHEKETQKSLMSNDSNKYEWKLCKTTAGPEYIPCLDNWRAIRKLQSISHYEHWERHCPEEAPTCLVPLPKGYRIPINWPRSREMIWYNNAPHTKLAEVKGHQNWVKVTGEYLSFPGGGTQFKHGALHYIEFIQKSLRKIAWGKRSRVILDVGCGVASFGGYLFEKDVLTMSLAPKDVHEAQVQFALERGIPAILGAMGSKRLPFPGSVFDLVHCARCRVPWHIEGGRLLLELNRVLRPGGYFVWSATPVYQKNPEDSGIWRDMGEITKSMCWDMVVIGRDKLNGVAAAIYRKPTSNECYNSRAKNEPPLCSEHDDANAAWNVSIETCVHKVPVGASERGSLWPVHWPMRLEKPPYWLNSQAGIYRRAAPGDFTADSRHWKNVLSHSYMDGMGIDWSLVRNVMDMRAVYGGFAAALKNLKVWVMNVVPIDSPNTLAIIYERGLFGIYHDWCESFNTYPRSYDLLHADYLFSKTKERCNIEAVIAEVDRIMRPEGYLIVRDTVESTGELESIAKSLQWDIRFTYSKGNEGLLCIQKTFWRPTKTETIVSAIA